MDRKYGIDRGLTPPKRLRLLFAARLVSVFGNSLMVVAIPWYVVTKLGSATGMGLVAAVEMIIISVTAIPSGAVLDKIGARKILLGGDIFLGCMSLLMAILGHSGLLTYPVLLALAAMAALPQAGYMAAISVSLRDIVGKGSAELTKASSERVIAQQIGGIAGSASAGILMAIVGWTGLMMIDAGTFLFSFCAFFLALPAHPKREETAGPKEKHGLTAGLTFLFRDRLLARRAVGAAITAMLFQALFIALPVSLRNEKSGSWWFGLIMGGLSVGTIIGSLLGRRLASRLDKTALLHWGITVEACAYVIPLLIPIPTIGPLGLFFVIGMTGSFASAGLFAILVASVPDDALGRLMTTWSALMTIAAPLGSLGGGSSLIM